MSKFVYADNAATTAVSQDVLHAMLPYFAERYGNPSSIYSVGRSAREGVDKARRQTADALGAKPEEIVFTSGGSESDNQAIRGAAAKCAAKGRHLITTAIEHHAVLHTMRALEKEGFTITYLRPEPDGTVLPETLEAAIRPDTTLVSIMYANNEIGTIQPIPAFVQICRARGILFHTDAVQAVGHVPIDAEQEGIDLLSLSAHKFHGPKGVGALYIRKGVRLPSLIEGGTQERGRRAGTENTPGIVGLGEALFRAAAGMEERMERVARLRDRLCDGLLAIPHTRLNGSRAHRLAGNLNISIDGIQAEGLLLLLDQNGICASAGSACATGAVQPSHVLTAIGLPEEAAHAALRLTLDDVNTDEDVDYIIETITRLVQHLRSLSPAWGPAQTTH
ncbi:cysteine desulfurase NifS [Ethanoligenens harbinense]|uniref:Cysteine desulfurase IscS n=1 Tax=Ethanoligenens harbinense (strain DSM 18485 / JCM 12961 / CGMCC 1.5033 / YUAN-3) TaxID=663278 RepID=E6U4R9_ETHHY|nr:cysteine desulfurase NifS [Ethanoligenens harbinense]ADU27804.1 cysteine desulfurase NifS [Ethanoligenens harbinense YUAN-3]AVQ96828.1 cysteine desulfurase NifS [Ethanoligenens harbinense YUAN-3]AYF39490.1 cysteine desulfurase NifS [Ethanoligenens harbinense]AYF42315.1 cysteine desulfurase NifS [Ethanoligenens harbinense]QCN93069.1 cysteine desulfurase NifS [Ethanoligenens harbinense]